MQKIKAQKLRAGDYVQEWNGSVREVRIGASIIEVRMFRYTFDCEVTVGIGWGEDLNIERTPS
jgi:hypothetical protein